GEWRQTENEFHLQSMTFLDDVAQAAGIVLGQATAIAAQREVGPDDIAVSDGRAGFRRLGNLPWRDKGHARDVVDPGGHREAIRRLHRQDRGKSNPTPRSQKVATIRCAGPVLHPHFRSPWFPKFSREPLASAGVALARGSRL